jgi:hypothetical protein
MEKVWFISIVDKAEGPFTLSELKNDPRVTPDTLVWKEGFAKWLPLRDVAEAAGIFKDDAQTPTPSDEPIEPAPEIDTNESDFPNKLADGELAILPPQALPPFPFWIFLIIFLIIYTLYLIQN